MNATSLSGEFPELSEDNRRIWDTNAFWWDDKIGDGNAFQEVLIEPAMERLLEIRPGDRVLDIACGAGRFARHMAELGATVKQGELTLQLRREKLIVRIEKGYKPPAAGVDAPVPSGAASAVGLADAGESIFQSRLVVSRDGRRPVD